MYVENIFKSQNKSYVEEFIKTRKKKKFRFN